VRRQGKAEVAALAALAYVPFLLSSPGRVSADSKQYLYLDPTAFLARAGSLWDPQIGAGTVPHQHLGYLVPMGPWFWVAEQAGVPDWVAQRLWLGTLSFAAVVGARWLFAQVGAGRAGALAGALVYLLSPYQLAFTARMSVLLLPWAALPWLVGCTMRATRTGRWGPPALLALVLVATGGVNATALLLVGVAPLLWVVLELGRGRDAARRALGATARIGVLAVGVSLWWVIGLRLQGAYGLPVLQLTENVRTVAEASTPGDLLRGLGNWFFYGRDRTGYSIDQAADYAGDQLVVVLSYALPALALAAALLLRWTHRAYFALLVVVGTVVGVGAWPADDPTPYGDLWLRFTSDTSVGLALRNSPRVVPVIALGLAGLLAGAVGAVRVERRRALAGAGVAVIALGALLPVWQGGYLTEGMSRPEEIPAYWQAAIDDLDAGDHRTRILEVPGASFAAYRWGTTVEPITPGLTDRPYLAREVLPYGTAPSVDLLDALDRRMQLGTFEPASITPLARLLGVGTIVLRADLEQAGRFDTPPPGPLWDALSSREAAGLGSPRAYGAGSGTDGDVPPVALFDVDRPQPIVRTAPAAAPVVLAGDGDGLVDAAAAGLLDGSGLVLEVAALDDATLAGALDAGAPLVLTDTNRRRIETWFYSLRDNRGPTERTGETAPDPTGYDIRLDPFPGSTDDSRTVVEHLGARVEATNEGGPERPEDRAARAVDGDTATAWRVGGADPRGEALTIVPDQPVTADEVRLVQPPIPPGGRAAARVRVTVDGGTPLDVDLTETARQPAGQAVPIPPTDVHELRIEVLETDPPSPTAPDATPVGLAEVRLGDLVVAETVRPPVDLLERVGDRLAGHSLDVVLTRSRLDLAGTDRLDDEAWIDRRIDLPSARSFTLVGTASVAAEPIAPSSGCRDDLVTIDGEPLAVQATARGDTMQLAACERVTLAAGSHRIVAASGALTGLDVDRLVLSSGEDGAPAAAGLRDRTAAGAGAEVTVRHQGATALDLGVTTDGTPFWLVLGQSSSDGWDLDVEGASVGERTLVDGYANGWLLTPDRSGTLDVAVRWRPQRLVGVGQALSGLAVVACLTILWRTRRRGERAAVPPSDLAARPSLVLARPAAPRATPVRGAMLAGAVVVGTALVAPLPIALVAGGATVVDAFVRRGRWLLVGLAVGSLAVSRIDHRPSLAWLAVAVLAGAVLVDAAVWLRGRAAPD
jgi:arabinofuranan 3-O-arabinosyltransferase